MLRWISSVAPRIGVAGGAGRAEEAHRRVGAGSEQPGATKLGARPLRAGRLPGFGAGPAPGAGEAGDLAGGVEPGEAVPPAGIVVCTVIATQGEEPCDRDAGSGADR